VLHNNFRGNLGLIIVSKKAPVRNFKATAQVESPSNTLHGNLNKKKSEKPNHKRNDKMNFR
jgi:hypothetical protein